MIPATIATLAMAMLVYAFILSPIIRELRGGSISGRPMDVDADLDDDDPSAPPDAPQTAADDNGVVASQPTAATRVAERVGTDTATRTTTTTSRASASASDA